MLPPFCRVSLLNRISVQPVVVYRDSIRLLLETVHPGSSRSTTAPAARPRLLLPAL